MCRLIFYINNVMYDTCVIDDSIYYIYLDMLKDKYDINLPTYMTHVHCYQKGVSRISKPNLCIFIQYMWKLCYRNHHIGNDDFLKALADKKTNEVKLTVSIYHN